MISIIIPVYNTENYLHKCLLSVLNQSFTDFEAICVDDGSSDNSLAVLYEYQRMDDRIIIVSQENGGVSKARNTGIKLAHGEYITFIDSDDWIHPQYLEALIEGIKTNQSNMSIISYREINNYAKEIEEDIINPSEHLKTYSIDQVMNKYKLKSRCWGKLYKKKIIDEERIRFPEGIKIGEDSVFVYEYFSKIMAQPIIAVIEADLYYYYHAREDSAIHIYGGADIITLVGFFVQSMDSANAWLRRNYAMEGLKKMLGIRYSSKLIHKKEMVKKCKNCIKMIFKKISIKELSFSIYALYKAFYFFPWMYRLFRIIKDPTMIKFEKRMKSYY